MKRHTAVSLAATFTLLCCSILPVASAQKKLISIRAAQI